MSAIFGILQLDDRPVEEDLLARFGRSLAHRGEGDPRVWTSGRVGLGCCHFPATPEAVGEVLPYVHPASGIVVTADARLDDREDLIAALGLVQTPGAVWPDSTLLAEAYLKWGDRCPEHLRGDFAFGLWDPQKKEFFAARDHFGIRPFYYTADGQRFAFATEPRPLLALPGVSQEIDRVTVVGYLAEIFDSSDRTAYQAVRRLREGERMAVTAAGQRIDRYYELDPERTLSFQSDAEGEEAFRDILFRSVRRRLRSSGPVGCMLSGGLDSSAIACIAAEIINEQPSRRLELFSLVYPEVRQCDESEYIQAVVRSTRKPWHAIPVHSRRSLRDVYDLVGRLQEPNVPFGAFGNGSVCAAAAAAGMRVVLDGHGGDETISLGYERLRELLDDRRLISFSYEYLLLSRAFPGENGFFVLLGVLTNRGLFGRIKRRLQLTASQLRGLSPANLDPTAWPYIRETPDREVLKTRKDLMTQEEAKARAQKRWHHHFVTRTAQSRAFETYGRLEGHNPVELRYPMWDKDLVEFCVALPSRWKLRHGYTRAILRGAMRHLMPPKITRRYGKNDFFPQAAACLKFLRKDTCMALLEDDTLPRLGILQTQWLNNVLNRISNGQVVSSPDQQAFWRSLSLAAWLQNDFRVVTNRQGIRNGGENKL